MHNPLHPVFGIATNTQKQPFVFLRHGILSNGTIFDALVAEICKKFPLMTASDCDQVTYDWKLPILINGLLLAQEILRVPAHTPVYLVGHSLGGLVSRVAAAALANPQAMLSHLSSVNFAWNFVRQDAMGLCGTLRQRKIAGLVTLATPNCGAVTHGQTALIAYFVRKAFSSKAPSLGDLTTDHLFRFLQRYAVDIPTLSISASGINAFSTKSRAPFKIAMGLLVPNDGIVEDVSVDLNRSILPNEVVNSIAARYLHVRSYIDCTDAWHTTIHQKADVHRLVTDFIALT